MNPLTPEQQAIGKNNFNEAVTSTRPELLNRREFIQASALAAAVPTMSLGTFYFGYSSVENPVRVGIIGTGDEGGVLMSNITPEYIQVVAICDIRPYNVWRAFNGDQRSPGTLSARQGLMNVYGWKTEDEARKHVKVYREYEDLLKDNDVEAVIIAVPLFLHHPVAIAAMKAGKHVLTEKLMAHNISQCKEMARVADETGLHLATGHQRHYSVLYDNAVHTIRQGLIGKIHHIRAQWHRGNLPGKDSWKPPLPSELSKDLVEFKKKLAAENKSKKPNMGRITALQDKIFILEKQLLDEALTQEEFDLGKYGYKGGKAGSYQYNPIEELIRWRLWNRTGGGLMAELGSHQLDAASIFISALDPDGEKVHPLSVTAVGGRHLFPQDRDCDDHVYCTYEFPAPEYVHPKGSEIQPVLQEGLKYPASKTEPGYSDEHDEKKVVVTYSSINGNGYGGYGEVCMGTEGTLILAAERDAMLFRGGSNTSIKVEQKKDGPAISSYETAAPVQAVETKAFGAYPPSRGYREEMEHWAWCIRNPAPENKPKCHPKVAMADAILALTANMAMEKGAKINFKKEWFDPDHPATPEEDLKKASHAV